MMRNIAVEMIEVLTQGTEEVGSIGLGVRGEWRKRKKPRITPAWWCHRSCKRKHRLRRGERRRRKKISLVELGFPSHLTVSISREDLINQQLRLEETLLLKIINLFQSFTPGSY